MADQWHFHSESFASCNCDVNCGCQFNLPSTHGHCQFVAGGKVVDGHFNEGPLAGLHWGMILIWPGEIAEGNGRQLIIIDSEANPAQREALEKILSGAAGAAGSNHFSVFGSTCSERLPTQYLPFDFTIDIPGCKARLEVPGYIRATGEPMINDFTGEHFRIALSRPSGSFEFTHAEIGHGFADTEGDLEVKLSGNYAQFCEHNYNESGLVKAA